MDPVTVIVAAVVAGATSGLTDSVKEEVKKAYTALRTRILERFSEFKLGLKALADVEKEATPDNQAYLAEALNVKGVTDGDELVPLAKKVVAATGLSIEQIQEVARNAVVRRSGPTIGLSAESGAAIKQVQRIGEGARVSDSPPSINVGRPSSD